MRSLHCYRNRFHHIPASKTNTAASAKSSQPADITGSGYASSQQNTLTLLCHSSPIWEIWSLKLAIPCLNDRLITSTERHRGFCKQCGTACTPVVQVNDIENMYTIFNRANVVPTLTQLINSVSSQTCTDIWLHRHDCSAHHLGIFLPSKIKEHLWLPFELVHATVAAFMEDGLIRLGNNDHFRQVIGLPQGHSLSSVLTNMVVGHEELFADLHWDSVHTANLDMKTRGNISSIISHFTTSISIVTFEKNNKQSQYITCTRYVNDFLLIGTNICHTCLRVWFTQNIRFPSELSAHNEYPTQPVKWLDMHLDINHTPTCTNTNPGQIRISSIWVSGQYMLDQWSKYCNTIKHPLFQVTTHQQPSHSWSI